MKKTVKRITAFVCLFAIVFAFCSCGANTETVTTTDNSIAETSADTAEYEAKFNELSEKYKDNGHPIAVIITNQGTMVFELYEDIAPITVANFISLANKGFYDGLIFHRCIEDFMIQGGDPLGTGMGGPGYTIEGEFSANGVENSISHKRGVVSMGRTSTGYDTAGSQFFICVADSTYLDGNYASFGSVLEGIEVADKIVAQETDSSDKPLTDQIMKYVRVATYGETYEAETIAE